MKKMYKFNISDLLNNYDYLYDIIEGKIKNFDNKKQWLNIKVVVNVEQR